MYARCHTYILRFSCNNCRELRKCCVGKSRPVRGDIHLAAQDYWTPSRISMACDTSPNRRATEAGLTANDSGSDLRRRIREPDIAPSFEQSLDPVVDVERRVASLCETTILGSCECAACKERLEYRVRIDSLLLIPRLELMVMSRTVKEMRKNWAYNRDIVTSHDLGVAYAVQDNATNTLPGEESSN